jgi:hypothetical protein
MLSARTTGRNKKFREEYVRRRARELAESGRFERWQGIEFELRFVEGVPEAGQLSGRPYHERGTRHSLPTGKVEKARFNECARLMPKCPVGEAIMSNAMPKPVTAPGQLSNAARIAKIVQLRDRAMVLLRERSKCQDRGGGHKLLCRDTEHLKITYAGPFQQRATDTSETTKYFQVVKGSNLPNMLGVWSKDPYRTVLFIEWADAGQIEVTSYKPGGWEAHLSLS